MAAPAHTMATGLCLEDLATTFNELMNTGLGYLKRREPEEALQTFQTCVEFSQQADLEVAQRRWEIEAERYCAESLIMWAHQLYTKRDFSKALELCHSAVGILMDDTKATGTGAHGFDLAIRSHMLMGQIFKKTSQYGEASKAYGIALELAEAAPDDGGSGKKVRRAECLVNLANAELRIGERKTAEALGLDAVKLLNQQKRIVLEKLAGLEPAPGTEARVLLVGEHTRIVRALEQAHFGLVNVYNMMPKQPERARKHQEHIDELVFAASQNPDSGPSTSMEGSDHAKRLHGQGLILLAQHQEEDARAQFGAALQALRSSPDRDASLECALLGNLGVACMELKRFGAAQFGAESAEAYFHQALLVAIESRLLLELAITLERLHELFIHLGDYSSATVAIVRAAELYAELQYDNRDRSEKWLALLDAQSKVYLNCQAFFLSQGLVVKALLWAERSRARVLISQLGKELLSTRAIDSLRHFDQDDQYAADALRTIVESHPSDPVFLVYTQLEKTIALVVVSKTLMEPCGAVCEGNETKRLVDVVLKYMAGAVGACDGAELDVSLTRLYDLLIRPASEYLKQLAPGHTLIVCPHENIANVPFAALRDRDCGPGTGYLLERYTIAFCPSLRILAQCQSRLEDIREKSPGKALLIGGVAYRNPDRNLEATADEIDQIGNVLGSAGLTSVKLTGEEARVALVLEHLSEAACVHFAAHGEFSEPDFPMGAISLSDLPQAKASPKLESHPPKPESHPPKPGVDVPKPPPSPQPENGEAGGSGSALNSTVDQRVSVPDAEASKKQPEGDVGKVRADRESFSRDPGATDLDARVAEAREWETLDALSFGERRRTDLQTLVHGLRFRMWDAEKVGPPTSKSVSLLTEQELEQIRVTERQHRLAAATTLTYADVAASSSCARLVVLSACNTARGKITSDGLLSLARAFTLAGVPCSVVSQWPVDDVDTSILMLAFYEKLVAGQDVACSLREAMLDLKGRRDAEGRAFPIESWAAFVVIGSPPVKIADMVAS